MNVLGGLRSRRASRADGPDGFISDGAELGNGHSREHGLKLAQHDGLGEACLALGERLAHADDGGDAVSNEVFSLDGHGFVVLTPEGAAFRMADEAEAHADVGEHGGGHFAREGALIPGRNRLGADSDPRVLEEADEFGQIDEGRAHGGPAVEIAEFGKEFLRPEAVGLGGAVPFPVGDDNLFTHAEFLQQCR